MRVALAIAGSAAVEGPVIEWVANHRKHHAYSDQAGDPHSPRMHDGALHETVLDVEELAAGMVTSAHEGVRLVDGNELFDLIESQRIEHAYAHDPNFAVSMSDLVHADEDMYTSARELALTPNHRRRSAGAAARAFARRAP